MASLDCLLKLRRYSSSFFDTGPRTETIFNYKVREYFGRVVVMRFCLVVPFRDLPPPPTSPISSVDSEAFETHHFITRPYRYHLTISASVLLVEYLRAIIYTVRERR